MGKRGPSKTPTSVLAQRGSWRGKVRSGEPKTDGSPIPPDWMNEKEAELWRELIPRLEGMGVVGSVDSYAVARYCSIFCLWLDCQEFIKKNGTVMRVKGADGKTVDLKEFPQVGRASRLADQLIRLEREYGMTASARASLAVDTTKKDSGDGDDMETILKLARTSA